MLRRPRRSNSSTGLSGDHSYPLHNAASGDYPVNNDSVSSNQQQHHARRRKQPKYTSLKRIQSYILRGDVLWKFAAISTSVVMCFWISLQLILRPSVVFTPKMRASNSRSIFQQAPSINTLSSSTYSILYKFKAKRRLVLPKKIRYTKAHPDFGGIELKMTEDKRLRSQQRIIYHDYHWDKGYSDMIADTDDEGQVESYYAFDDDAKRNPYEEYDDPGIRLRKQCRRTSWHRDMPLSCNSLHEFDFPHTIAIGRTKFLRSGAYRQVYLVAGEAATNDDSFVLKMFTPESEFNYEDYEFARMDANVNEKLNGSPRIVSMYSYCGISITSEAMMRGDLEIVAVPTGVGRRVNMPNNEEQLIVRNTLSGTQKLVFSLEMAEAVLLLHTFPNGVIVHDDIQLSQFLLSSSGQIKLNDFNRAEIMLWNEKDYEYCMYRNHPGGGDWRAPEEYLDHPLNEKIDIWSLGNNMYTLLTGMYPFYDSKEADVSIKVSKGLTSFIDPRYMNRSFAEAKLAEIIPQCWIYDATQRIDIVQLVDFLRIAVRQNSDREGLLQQLLNVSERNKVVMNSR